MTEPESFLEGRVHLHRGDCLAVLRRLADCSIDSVVTDPPYALVSIVKRFGAKGAKPTRDGDVYSRASAGFMGKAWDTGERAFAVEFWAEVLRVLKPGGHLVAFSGTRTYHRMVVAIEDAGFEIRDQIGWLYGSGFPKSHDVSKAIDRHNGDERAKVKVSADAPAYQRNAGNHRPWMDNPDHMVDGPEAASAAWQGWGTALKPAWEPIVLARKGLIGTVAENVLEHSTGALNVEGCRVGADGATSGKGSARPSSGVLGDGLNGWSVERIDGLGRWPANVVHDGSDETSAAFPGDASRFFYSAKADAHDRVASKHPTVKPVDLMQWLVRLVTPKGGTVLDPFAGTGTTGEAAWREGMNAVLVEREDEYAADIARRMRLAVRPAERAAAAKARGELKTVESLPLFGGGDETTAFPGQTGGGRLVYGHFAADKSGRRG